ncbi:MAG: outer membrane protein assembly factor [Candidatus Velthaea sp.]
MFDWFRGAPRIVLASLAFLGLVMPPAISQTQGPTVVSVSVSGNAHIATDRILAVVKTKVGDPFNPATVQEDLRAISDLGFFSDQAPPVIKQRPDGVAITFRVIENPVITSIQFNGNGHVPADTLLALMDTATGQVFNLKTYQQDVLKINSYYDKIGYGGQVPSHVTDVNIDPKGVLTLKVQEGLLVRDVIVTGDYVLNPTLIKSVLLTKAGTPYSEDQRDKDVERLKDLYKQYDLQIGDFEAGIDPATVDTKAGTADVRYTISVARVGAVEITGNTKTHDDVIRRELRLRPGMILTESGVRRDYDRLNNLGFFEKVELNPKPGPDPKKPALLTLDWAVKEQRTGTAQIGAGYSGGLTGTGLTGTLSYSENNINGTGNGGSIRLERGARTSDASLSVSVPYVGKTAKSQKYSFGATIFTNQQTNFYPVYFVPTPTPAPGATTPATVPVSIIPQDPTNPIVVDGIASTYKARSTGVNATIGRRLNDVFRVSVGANISQVASSADVPAPFFFPTVQNLALGAFATPSPSNPLGSDVSGGTALGVTAPSIANIDSTRPFKLRSLIFGLGADNRDDIFNPRRGANVTLSDEISGHSIGSDFNYSIYMIDAAKFFPVLKKATLGFHGLAGLSSGAIPPNKLFTFSDQQLRGYTDPFYGTDEALFQTELRVPLTADRKFSIVGFAETGGTRIRGAAPVIDATTGNIVNLNRFTFHSDVGVGLRFDVPQLGLKTIRLDFARGANGTHTAFGIGQSF